MYLQKVDQSRHRERERQCKHDTTLQTSCQRRDTFLVTLERVAEKRFVYLQVCFSFQENVKTLRNGESKLSLMEVLTDSGSFGTSTFRQHAVMACVTTALAPVRHLTRHPVHVCNTCNMCLAVAKVFGICPSSIAPGNPMSKAKDRGKSGFWHFTENGVYLVFYLIYREWGGQGNETPGNTLPLVVSSSSDN